ncbi:MAG: 23S rRNA (pseudouridine(1915)-N(3))-methyltransferase RlmH [Hyphomonadaceae bacterium]|nr:23S rRNA (pseudouridine(1915)-N(3))-methyltransferase RlmH [Hyphomonadaceae bacterium]
MRIVLTCGGIIRQGPERELLDDYIRRANLLAQNHGFPRVHENEIDLQREKTRADETQKLFSGLSDRTKRIILDERGESLSTRAMATQLDIMREDRWTGIYFVIGGADGLDHSRIDSRDKLWCLGRATWPHKLLRIMLAEQVYRIYSIWAGTPYHRS